MKKVWTIVLASAAMLVLFARSDGASRISMAEAINIKDVQARAGLASPATVTVSGTIRHLGSPVSGVEVNVVWSSGDGTDTTGSDGIYSVSGVPTGGEVMIFVRPPIAQRLAFRNWSIDPLTGDLTKDFDLEDGQQLQGEFRKPDGTPYAKTFWLETNPSGFSPPPDEWYGVTAFSGNFDLVLPKGIYTLRPNPAPSPYYMPRTKLDLRTSDVTGLVITLLDQRPPPFPITPPRASLITVGDPAGDDRYTVTGAAGAVEPLSAVAVINLSSYIPTTTTADANGAFTATLYAPPGSSLLVKYDPVGDRVARLWQDIQTTTLKTSEYLNPLPGTILHVGAPPAGSGSSQAFSDAGLFYQDAPRAWAGWWISGTLQVPPGNPGTGLHVQRGQPVTFTARLRVTVPAITCIEPLTYTPKAHVQLRYLFGADGHADPWGIWFNAHLFTPTGLPIEHEASGETRPVVSANFTGLTCVGRHVFDGFAYATFVVPNDLPDGIYQTEAWIESGGVSLDPNTPMVQIWYHHEPAATLPSLTVGSSGPPRIPWVLLGDYSINGHRGAQAREDIGRFAMPTRIVFPARAVIVPRLDERSGKPLVYRLEPGSPWLSSTDRREPNPPRIPLKLPSGTLTVQVHKPDGSTDTLGPTDILQSSVRTPTTPGGTDLDDGTGQIGDLYHLTTMDDAFAYSFDQYGYYTINLDGSVDDIYGNTYPIAGTYDVVVARVLDLDPAELPTTPYQQGDAFAPGLHIFPPVMANVNVRFVQMPYSDPAQVITTTIIGQANRLGYFQPPVGTVITLTAPGEFRADIYASYTAPDGTFWAGAVTWGNVVEGPVAQIEAHGRRGMDYKSDTISDMPAWFEVFDLVNNRPDKVGIENYYPYFNGDIHWGNQDRQPGDSIHSIITIRDKAGYDGTIYNIMRGNWSKARNGFRWPPVDTSLTGLNKRLAVGEAPLFTTTGSGIDPAVAPNQIDQWSYWYGSSERPDVHVREILSEDNMGTAYWRFNDTYGYQIGEGALGDLPGDIKWEFGGAVFRIISPTNSVNDYAIYSSLWVLLPDGDPIGARVTAPFRGANGTSIDGGPIMTLQGKDIDMLFLPKGVRPGDVLEVGDVIAFSGHVGPPLDSQVSVTITAPSHVRHVHTWHANKIGWLYDPTFDFVANEPGRWMVDVSVLHDRPLAYAAAPTSHNTGTVLGATGQYEFYVVEPGSPKLFVTSPQPGFVTWPTGHIEPIPIQGIAPAGTTAVRYTIHDKGVVMGQGSVTPDASGIFTVTYDAQALHTVFPFVSLTAHEGIWEGLADEVEINLLSLGTSTPHANTVTLIGEEVFIGNEIHQVFLPVVLKEP